MSLTTDSMSAADLAAVMDNNKNGFAGGDGLYAIIVLFILMAMLGNGFGGFGGGNNAFYAGQGDLQRGFDQSAIMTAINGVSASINALGPQLCNGFAGVNATVNSGFANAETSANARQMANMQQLFNAQTAVDTRLDGIAMTQQNCCCENRAAIADLKYTIAQEAAATRAAGLENTRAITDKLCQLEMDGIKGQLAAAERENLALQNQLNMSALQASQAAQTAAIVQDNNAQTAQLIQRIAPYPTPSYQVPNPYVGCGCAYNACGA